MQHLENVVKKVLGNQAQCLFARIVARTIGLDPDKPAGSKIDLNTDVHDLARQDILASCTTWNEIAQAIGLITAFEPDKSSDWLKSVSTICFPMEDGNSHPFQNSRTLGCFMGILESIEWLDSNSPNNSPDGEDMQIILQPFLIDPESFKIETSDQGFQDAQKAKLFHGQLSNVLDSIADTEHMERWVPIMKELTEMQLSSDNYFHDEFLREWAYSTFGSLKESYQKAAVLLWAYKTRQDEDDKEQQKEATE